MIVKNPLPKVLICDDDRTLHLAVKSALGKDFDIRSAYTVEEAVLLLKKSNTDLILLDMDLGNGRDGLTAIPRILEIQSDIRIILFSGSTDFELVRDGMKLGAFDYIQKGCGLEELRHHRFPARRHRPGGGRLPGTVRAQWRGGSDLHRQPPGELRPGRPA
jgi:DNA-binding NtrC family response regulator